MRNSNKSETMNNMSLYLACYLSLFFGCFGQLRIENVALHKTCTIESSWNPSDQPDKAVNNDTSGQYPENCIHTGDKHTDTWWEVDLGRSYPVYSITVWARADHIHRMKNCVIKVDGHVCFSFPESDITSREININCSTGVINGSKIRVSKSSSTTTNGDNTINICEFQVWSCTDPFWGAQCDTKCGNCIGDSVCNKVTGHCSCKPGFQTPLCDQECANGTYGENCSSVCGRCMHPMVCDKVDGHCSRCEPGLKLPLCKEACDVGKYGQDCNNSCGQGCSSSVCDPFSGQCNCTPGWQSPLCQKCSEGLYGANCSQLCGSCVNISDCHWETGVCSRGCTEGFTGNLCQTACDVGKYGQDCKNSCGQGCSSSICDPISGQCNCTPGWQSSLCQKCSEGLYGANCSQLCGSCVNVSDCHWETGVCSRGCTEGFTGNLCQTAIAEGDVSGIIAGSVVGGLVVLLTVVVLMFIVIRRKRSSTSTPGVSLIPKPVNSPNLDGVYENSVCRENNDNEGNKPIMVVKPHVNPKIEAQTAHTDGVVYSNVSIGKGKQPLPFSPQTTPCLQKSSTETDVSVDMDDESDAVSLDNIYINGSVYVNSEVPGNSWDDVQQHLLNKLRDENFDEEFGMLSLGLRKAHNAGLAQENYNKNRFMSILPYDDNRVVLQEPYDADCNDYINASYIRGFTSPVSYIAAQGPKRKTINDFWKMVWQEHATHIVMLTNTVEGEKTKCEQYWPSAGSKKVYGNVHVTGRGEQERADFAIRTFDVRCKDTDSTRRVTQYHYTSWLDHSIPTPLALVDFWRTVRTSHRHQHPPSPLLVHCSAGVGRTGTYIALDLAFDQAGQQTYDVIDIAAIVARIREDRCNMIQAKSQYIFLYEAVLEAYSSRHARFDISAFDSVFPRGIDPHKQNDTIDAEFKTLQNMQNLFHKADYSEALKGDNLDKNRCSVALPDDKHLVHLTAYIPGRNQYINAVFIPTFKQRMGRILTQLPLSETVLDLWRLVYGNGTQTIICLDPETDIEISSLYWPRKDGNTMEIGPYTLTLNSKEYVEETVLCYKLSIRQHNDARLRHISLLHYLSWTDEVPADASQLLNLIDAMETLQTHNYQSPILVQCFNGASKSGLFSATCDVISRMNYDREIDVYMAVRHVKDVRPESVTSLVQYRYLYKVAEEFKKQMDIYSNV